jgi:hypothetical protein
MRQYEVPESLEHLLRDLSELIGTKIYFYNDNEAYHSRKYGIIYENDTFMMHTYCWCDKVGCLWCACNDGEETECAPNFHYKPTDYQLEWYKYIGRGMVANKDINAKEIVQMMIDCINSLEVKNE